MPFINIFTVRDTSQMAQNNSWRQDPVKCVHLPFHRNQAAPPLHSSPHGNPDARPTGELQHLTKCSLCLPEDPGPQDYACQKKSNQHTGWRWSRQVSGLTTVLPGHRDSGAFCCRPTVKRGTLTEIFLNGEGYSHAVPDRDQLISTFMGSFHLEVYHLQATFCMFSKHHLKTGNT